MSERSDLLVKYRAYYNSDITVMHTGFTDRFKNENVSTPLALANFVAQNETRACIDKRLSMIPIDGVTITAIDENGKPVKSVNDYLAPWLKGPNFSSGKNFYSYLSEMAQNNEIDGEIASKLIIKKGTPQVRRIPDANMTIKTDPENIFETIAYKTTWEQEKINEEGDVETVTVSETVNATDYIMTVGSKEASESHNFGFLPVVLLKREDQEGTPHGRSGIADLMEPQDNINRAASNIGRANKYGPWGLYCPKSANDPIPDGDISIEPGTWNGTPMEKVSGEGAGQSLFDELEETTGAMYRIAGISRNSTDETKGASNASGKAQIVLNAQGKRYVSGQLARYKAAIAMICRYAMVMAKKMKLEDKTIISVDFPSLDQEDPAAVNARATILFNNGFQLTALQVMGYSEEEAKKIIRDANNSTGMDAEPDGETDDDGNLIKKPKEEGDDE